MSRNRNALARWLRISGSGGNKMRPARAEAEKKAAEQAAESLRKSGEQAAKNLEEKAKDTREQK